MQVRNMWRNQKSHRNHKPEEHVPLKAVMCYNIICLKFGVTKMRRAITWSGVMADVFGSKKGRGNLISKERPPRRTTHSTTRASSISMLLHIIALQTFPRACWSWGSLTLTESVCCVVNISAPLITGLRLGVLPCKTARTSFSRQIWEINYYRKIVK